MGERTCTRCPAFVFAAESLAAGLCHGCRSPAPEQRVGPPAPKRIQRKRTKGWKLPPNAVCVTRPGQWGNRYRVGFDGTAEECVAKFRALTLANIAANPDWLAPLRGKDLACFCAIGAPCHADVLLELANKGG